VRAATEPEWAVATYPSVFDWKAKVGLKQITDLVMNGMPQIVESSVPVHKFLVRWREDGSYDPEDVAITNKAGSRNCMPMALDNWWTMRSTRTLFTPPSS
jgi:hypothetical protein